MFLDLESNPYVLDQGLEYLIGVVTLPVNSGDEPTYEALWSFTRSEEKKAFETFIANVMERWRRNPEMHIYHYAPYEPTAIKRLVGRHGTCVDEVDELLRAGVFVDLYRAVRQGIRASVESYSIKRLEPLYGFTRAVPLRDANFALQSYEAAMALGNDLGEIGDLLKTIEGYNRDDCMSALRLRDWLEDRRKELEAKMRSRIATTDDSSLASPRETELPASKRYGQSWLACSPRSRKTRPSGRTNTGRFGSSPRCWNGIAGRKNRLGGNTSGFATIGR